MYRFVSSSSCRPGARHRPPGHRLFRRQHHRRLRLQAGQSYPDYLQQKLDDHGYHYKVSNQGTSGATTKDAVASLPSDPASAAPEIVICRFAATTACAACPADDGDHDRFAHYAKKADIARAYVTGEAIVALCGKKWVPSRDPSRYPICPTCAERKAAVGARRFRGQPGAAIGGAWSHAG